MKILAFADCHLKGGFDTEEAEALLKAADIANERSVDVVLVNGDIFEAKSTPVQRLVFKTFLGKLQRRNVQTIILRGNHDEAQDLTIFEDITQNIWVSEEPGEFLHPIPGGISLQVLTIPHFNAGALALQEDTQESLGDKGTDIFGTILDSYFQKVRSHEGPSIVAFHGTVSDAALDNGYIPRQNGIHLNLDKLAMLGCPVTGGHYHRHQEVGYTGSGVWYSGSLTRQTYGESEGDKGVLLFEYENGVWKQPEFISLNPSPMILIEAQFIPNDEYGVTLRGGFYFHDNVSLKETDYIGSKVRFRYTVQQKDLPLVNLRHIHQLFGHSKELKIEQIVEVSTAVRSEAMAQAESVEQCLAVWLESKGMEAETDKLLALYAEIMSEKAAEPVTLNTEPAQLSLVS